MILELENPNDDSIENEAGLLSNPAEPLNDVLSNPAEQLGEVLSNPTESKDEKNFRNSVAVNDDVLEHENLEDFLEKDSVAEEFVLHLEDAKASIEAILFATGDPISLERISSVLGYEKEKTRKILSEMIEEYEHNKKSGLLIRQLNEDYTMATKPSIDIVLQRLFLPRNRPPMTQAAYETLSIIAYNQPVTRAQVESVRGVSSDSIIARLIEKNLIQDCGYLDAPGRPTLFETSELFLKEFGLSSVRELPPIDMMMYGTLRDMETSLSNVSGAEQNNQITIEQIVETILPGQAIVTQLETPDDSTSSEIIKISNAIFGESEETEEVEKTEDTEES